SGKIISNSIYSWSNRWIRQIGIPVAAEKDQTDIEASVLMPSLNGTRIVVQSTDWASIGDITSPASAASFTPLRPFDVTSKSLVPPHPNDFAGNTFYLRAAASIDPIDCVSAKSLNTTRGTGAGTNFTLSTTNSFVCFFTTPA